MAAQTGNTYTSGTMTDSIEIPTANLGFSTENSIENSRVENYIVSEI